MKSNNTTFYGIFGAVGVVMVGGLGYQLLTERNHSKALAEGQPVVAQVARLEEGNCLVGEKGHDCLRLTLKVYPDGGEPYTASLTHVIDLRWASRVQPGSWLTVVADRNDPTQLYFDEESLKSPPPKAQE